MLERFEAAGLELEQSATSTESDPAWRIESRTGVVTVQGDPVRRIRVLTSVPEIAQVSESGQFPGSTYVGAMGVPDVSEWVAEQLRTNRGFDEWKVTKEFGTSTAQAQFSPSQGATIDRGSLAVSVTKDGP